MANFLKTKNIKKINKTIFVFNPVWHYCQQKFQGRFMAGGSQYRQVQYRLGGG